MTAKWLYIRNPSMDPTQFLFMRALLATVILLIYVNKNIFYILSEPCRKGQTKKLVLRAVLQTFLVSSAETIIKYLSLIYIGLTYNVTPLVTVFMSYFMIGEQIKYMDLFLLLITLIGAGLITIGY